MTTPGDMLENSVEKRSSARIPHDCAIVLENFEVGVMHEARMYNYSKLGLYFESDFYLLPGTEIYIGINNSPFSSEPDVYECYRAIIRWRRFLEDSPFDYGYGVEVKRRVSRREKPRTPGSCDSRRHPRRACAIPAIIETKDRRMRGVIQNGSYGGVFISCAETLAKGQRVYLTIPLQKKQKIVTRRGEVLWSDGNGVGIRFQTPADSQPHPSQKPESDS
jgi:PilZ domain